MMSDRQLQFENLLSLAKRFVSNKRQHNAAVDRLTGSPEGGRSDCDRVAVEQTQRLAEFGTEPSSLLATG